MMNIFSKEDVNTGRQFEFDIVRAICVFIMVFVHCFEDLPVSDLTRTNEGYYILVIVLDAVFGAGTFMAYMGLGIRYSKNSTPKKLMLRGLLLFLAGYLLAFLRYGFWMIIGSLIGNVDPIYIPYEILVSEILHFAGLSLILIGLFKLIKLPDWSILIIAISLSIIGSFVRGISIENVYLSTLLGIFVGVNNSVPIIEMPGGYFPLFNWFIIVALGYFYGKLLRKVQNKDKFYAFAFPISVVALTVYLIIAIPNKIGMLSGDLTDLYFFTTPEAIVMLFGMVFSTGLFYFISKLFSTNVKKVFTHLSANTVLIYFIHWVILGFFNALLYLLEVYELPVYIILIFALTLYAVSCGLAELINKIKSKAKKEKEIKTQVE